MSVINKIATLMTEQMAAPGMTSAMSGGAQAQTAMNMLPGEAQQPQATTLDMGEEAEEACRFAPEHIQAAQKLIALVGSADKARELIDKVDEAMEVFDDGEDDAETIDLVASLIPDAPDMPMQRSITRISSMFDPSAGATRF